MNSIFESAAVLAERDPTRKAFLSREAAEYWREGVLWLNGHTPLLAIAEPGRPPQPLLVPPRELPKRGFNTPAGRAALIHAVAHIEFNAINLAWDAVYRFRDMPQAFYDDWVG